MDVIIFSMLILLSDAHLRPKQPFMFIVFAERELLILQAPKDLGIQEDQNAVFVCELSVEDMPGEWYKNGERIQPTSTIKIRQEGGLQSHKRAYILHHSAHGVVLVGCKRDAANTQKRDVCKSGVAYTCTQ